MLLFVQTHTSAQKKVDLGLLYNHWIVQEEIKENSVVVLKSTKEKYIQGEHIVGFQKNQNGVLSSIRFNQRFICGLGGNKEAPVYETWVLVADQKHIERLFYDGNQVPLLSETYEIVDLTEKLLTLKTTYTWYNEE